MYIDVVVYGTWTADMVYVVGAELKQPKPK